MISLEELLSAPLLPNNLPTFEIINECQKIEEKTNSDISEASEEEDEDSDEVEEVFPCDCGYDEHSTNFDGQACGSSANCINRALFIECNGDECPCRDRCQNRRFQKRKYSNVKVIETPGKGFGLFACEDLKSGALVMEYVGEIVNQEHMGRRAVIYAKQGQPHFYFMTLRPNQIIDATCKGNLSRFMNHSCAPNCETQKWIVGGKIKIGLFALKNIKIGTELTFDYKFVRFGKAAQKCLCGEPNCTGFIGVSSKMSKTRKARRAASCEDEDEFELFMETNPESAELPGQISLIVSKLIQTDNLELIKKLLTILKLTKKYLCQRKFLNLHGLKLLSNLFSENSKDQGLISFILEILKELPLNTKNSIEDSGWNEKLIEIIKNNEYNLYVLELAKELKVKWDNLEAGKVSDKPLTPSKVTETLDSKEKSALMSVPSEFSSALQKKRQQWTFDGDFPKSPRSSDLSGSRSPVRRSTDTAEPAAVFKMIPDPKWLSAKAPDGRTYYYHSTTRETAWEIPMILEKRSEQSEQSEKDIEVRDNISGNVVKHPNNRRNYESHDSRDSRDLRYTKDYRRDYSYRDNYRSHSDSNDYRDLRINRTRRDQLDYKYLREPRETQKEDSHSLEQTKNSSFLEGVGNSSQLAAIIERAKVRRTREQEEGEVDGIDGSPFLFNPSPSPENYSSGKKQPSPPSGNSKKYYSKLREEVSGAVIRFFSHYRQELGGEFKELARKYTHKIIEKELKDSPMPTTSKSPDSLVLSSKKKQKIKIYLAEVIKGRKIKLLSEHETK